MTASLPPLLPAYRADFALPTRPDRGRGCRSSLFLRPSGREAPAPFGCRDLTPAGGSQTSDAACAGWRPLVRPARMQSTHSGPTGIMLKTSQADLDQTTKSVGSRAAGSVVFLSVSLMPAEPPLTVIIHAVRFQVPAQSGLELNLPRLSAEEFLLSSACRNGHRNALDHPQRCGLLSELLSERKRATRKPLSFVATS